MTKENELVSAIVNPEVKKSEKEKAYSLLHKLCKSIIRKQVNAKKIWNSYDREEIETITLEKILLNLNRYDDSKSFEAWVCSITNNVKIDYLRKHYKKTKDGFSVFKSIDNENEYGENTQIENIAVEWTTPEDILSANDLAASIKTFIKNQPKELYRNVLTMRFMDRLDCKKIAELLGIPTGTVLTILHRSKIALKNSGLI